MAWVLNYPRRMKNLSIKLQLTVLYTLSIIIVSTILFLSFYVVTQRSIVTETDRSLLSHASSIAENVGLNTGNVFDDQTGEIISVSRSQILGLYLEVTDSNGHLVGGEETPSIQELSQKAVSSSRPSYANIKIGNNELRMVSYPIQREGRVVGTIVMGHPVDVYTNALIQLRTTLILLTMFFIVPSIILGFLLSKNAVSPLTSLSKRISEITEEKLSDSIEVPSKSLETYTLVTNFNNLLSRLRDAFLRERQFIGDVAHEIKTPLSVVKSGAEVTLSKERAPDEYKAALSQIISHVNRLSKNLSGLVDFAWSQTTDVSKQFSKVNLTELLSELCNTYSLLTESKKINLSCNFTNEVRVRGKKEKLNQVFANLMDNAIKFTPEGGSISLELTTERDMAVTKVADTGVGISKVDIKAIFDRFYRSDTAKNAVGHGLGLAIAHSIVQAHQGNLSVESKEGKGSTFRVELKLSS